MLKIIADKDIPYLKGLLEPYANVHYLPFNEISRESIRGADGLIVRTRTKCGAGLLKGTKVRAVVTASAGDDHIDHEYCDANGISWAASHGCNADAVAEYVLIALHHLAGIHNFKLVDKTLGIIGVGNVGSRLAWLADKLGMKVLLNDPPRHREEKDIGFSSLEATLAEADIISLHIPLTSTGPDPTFHLANEAFFWKIQKPCIFINTSRGEVTDSRALMQAIDEGKLIASVLDVFENEPDIRKDIFPAISIVTPHIAGYSIRGKINATIQAVMNLNGILDMDMKKDLPLQLSYPEKKQILLPADTTEVLIALMKQVYDIGSDDSLLRHSNDPFELIRKNYNLRFQFADFDVQSGNLDTRIAKTIRALGFQIS